MLKLFAARRPDHPMANPKEAKRILAELPLQDAVKVLEELSHWFESVAATEGFGLEERVQILCQIDDAGQPSARKLARDYAASARASKFQEHRIWTAIHEYWNQAGHAFARAIDEFVTGTSGAQGAKSVLPVLLVRTLRSLGQQIRWMHVRYGPIELPVLGILNRVYGFAESRGFAGVSVAAYPAIPGESTPQHEFLKCVVLSASSPDALQPFEVELVERLVGEVGELASRFTLSATSESDSSYWIDLNENMAPQRMLSAPLHTPTLRYLGATAALAELHQLIRNVESSGAAPPTLGLAGVYDAEIVLDVLHRLALYWSPEAPERSHARHNVRSGLSIAHGFDDVLGVLGALQGPFVSDAPGGKSENWVIENVSSGGFGALVTQIKGDWVKVGALVAMQPGGGSNWLLGIVRRVSRLAGQQARVGIQTLSRSPLAVRFTLGAAAAEGLLLRAVDSDRGEVSIVLRPGVFVHGQKLEAEQGAHLHIYLPQGLVERADDYEIVRFREMIREN